MTKVWLLRHGQTEANVIGRFAGRTAEALTEEGRAQAREAGRRLRGEGIKRIYASPLPRTMETARLLAEELESPVEIVPEEAFLEINIPPWEGRLKVDLRQDPAMKYEVWSKTPHLFALPGCESLQEVLARAVAGCESVFEKEAESAGLIVTHMVVVRVLLVHYLGLPLSAYREIPVPNATPILLVKSDGQVKIEAPFELPKPHVP